MLAFLGMIGGLFGLNPLGKAARLVGGVALAIACALLLWGAKAIYDANLVRDHDARQAVETEKADRQADTRAAEQRRADESRLNQEQQELEKVQANAQTDTDRRLARHRCLRLQQAARAAGHEPPTCH